MIIWGLFWFAFWKVVLVNRFHIMLEGKLPSIIVCWRLNVINIIRISLLNEYSPRFWSNFAWNNTVYRITCLLGILQVFAANILQKCACLLKTQTICSFLTCSLPTFDPSAHGFFKTTWPCDFVLFYLS